MNSNVNTAKSGAAHENKEAELNRKAAEERFQITALNRMLMEQDENEAAKLHDELRESWYTTKELKDKASLLER